MLNILESRGELCLEDQAGLEAMGKKELIGRIRLLMRDSFDLLSAMEYLHAQDLSDLETSLLEKFQALEKNSQQGLNNFEKDLQDQETYLTDMDRRLNSTTEMLESID